MELKKLLLNFPGRSHVGQGAVEELGTEAARLGSSAMLVTGRRALAEAGITDRLTGLMEEAGLDVTLFVRVPPEPEVEVVDELRETIAGCACDLVVEAGGGSAMDVGKAAAALAREKAATDEYQMGRQEISTEGLPHVAVATTSGTGSEVTKVSVLINRDEDLKKSVRAPGIMPDVSITDPELTVPCPPRVTAASGMDAFVQAVESYLSRHAIPVTESLSLRAASLIHDHLPAAYSGGEDRQARNAVAQGSYMAGLALGSARLGAVHGLAHPVGLLFDRPHGEVCAALLPEVLRRNRAAAGEKYDILHHALGGDPVARTQELLDELNLSRVLGDYPGDEGEKMVIDYALDSGSSAANPVGVTPDYVRAVLDDITG